MSSLTRRIARDVFASFTPGLVYAVAARAVSRQLSRQQRTVPPVELQELIHDAVCRGFGSFVNRCDKGLPKLADRKAWVCQCVVSGAKNACKTARRFGDPAPFRGYVDALNRRGGLEPRGFWHATDAERSDALEQMHYVPVQYEAQGWEIMQLLKSQNVPEHLHTTALAAAMGFSQADSAELQKCTERTVRNRLTELRDWFNPSWNPNPYAVICSALAQA